VIFSAVYALSLYRRVVFGEMVNPKLAEITDLETREWLIFIPLIIATLVFGVQPNLIFDATRHSVEGLVGAYQLAIGGH
jgi:NADH-quinone oxidoreductase subunit M